MLADAMASNMRRDSRPGTKPKSVSKPKPRSKFKPKSTGKFKSKPRPKSKLKLESKLKPKPKLESASQPRSKTAKVPKLAGFQRKALRALANPLKAVIHVGEAGLSPGLLRALDAALLRHELVKVRMHEPDDKKAAAALLAEQSRAALCGLVGHTVILYRPNPDDPTIELPRR